MVEGVPDKLARIIDYKRGEVAALKSTLTVALARERARSAPPPRDFTGRILKIAGDDGNALIGEVKRRSPSAGVINLARDPIEAAKAYEEGGAACISVLTDGPSFGGSLEDLVAVRNAVELPVLRKDFTIDPVQIYEARAAGADAILLIMAVLDDVLARELHDVADEVGLSVLLEAHNEAELARALALPSPLIGVNNRDLRKMATDLAVTERLAPMVPTGKVLISESGVRDPADIARLRICGARGFLIGESLMRSEEPSSAVRALVETR
ncbi:MAG: indole-3-glycerol phosphate synthase TrpC [Hyphomonadaceae bacterium]